MSHSLTAAGLAARADDTAAWYRARRDETKAGLWARQATSFRAMSRPLVACPDCSREWPTRDDTVPWHLRLGTGRSCGPTPWVDPLATD